MVVEEEFSEGTSFLHGLDPRVKIVVTILYSVVVAVSHDFSGLVAAFFLSLFLVGVSRLSLSHVGKRLLLANGLVLFLWLFLPLTYGGETWFVLGPFSFSREGMIQAIRITLKCNSIVLVMVAALSTTPIFNLGHAMRDLRVPDKIVQLFLFTYRYIHVIFKEYVRLTNAMKMRGFVPRSDLHTYKSYAHLVGMLFVRSYDRAERIHRAMLLRGFTGRYYSLHRFSIGGKDILFLVTMMCAIMGLVWVQWVSTI